MLNKIKKLFFLLILSQVVNANSSRAIVDYSDLLNSLSRGDSVRAVMFINKCSMIKNTLDSNDVIAGINFTNFNKYRVIIGAQEKNVIATSINPLIEHGRFGTVYNYVRLRVFDDNSAEIFSEYIHPVTYKQLGAMTVHCAISKGLDDQQGVLLYDAS